MCLILFAYNTDPHYRLVVAANRDEFYQRPTRRLCFWPEAPDLLAGQDLQLGGTWLGITRQGRFAAVTNFRQGRRQPSVGLLSRGQLTLDFLLGEQQPLNYLQQADPDAYDGFNLLLADQQGLYYGSNRNDQSPKELEPGVYGLSNASLDTPWPKVREAREELGNLIEQGELSVDNLLKLLQHNQKPADDQLPDTGVGLEWERLLSPRFIRSEDYGTRSSLVLLQRYDGHTEVVEQSYLPEWQKPQGHCFSTT
ncbi:NRDE family protein [Motiliproteus coralliicola]|uniref:NRDE family protein n=1 Tax=Motiliproteus coralliicola TaxID=2283196 RepID=A0A369WA23_9GAMM|nr:NRDE family protein [Motiliproteus coralliicola]RDE18171.1 NRDE family protein [Motiliproteus coralliicola]